MTIENGERDFARGALGAATSPQEHGSQQGEQNQTHGQDKEAMKRPRPDDMAQRCGAARLVGREQQAMQ